MSDDENSQNYVGLSANWSKSGVSIKLQSKFFSAVDRLLGTRVDVKGLNSERIKAVRQAQIENEVHAIKKLRLTSDDDVYVHGIGKVSQLNEQLISLENKVAVIEEAYQMLTDKVDESQLNESVLDEDWLNSFSDFASKSSSEARRKLIGSILAKKIAEPEAYSLTTLRVASELQMTTIEDFKSYAAGVWGEMIVLPRLPKGKELFKLMELEDAGLITGHNGSVSVPFHVEKNGQKSTTFGQTVVILKSGNQPINVLLPIVATTKAGRELSQLFEFSPEACALAFATARAPYVEYAALHQIIHQEGDMVHYQPTPYHVLK